MSVFSCKLLSTERCCFCLVGIEQTLMSLRGFRAQSKILNAPQGSIPIKRLKNTAVLHAISIMVWWFWIRTAVSNLLFLLIYFVLLQTKITCWSSFRILASNKELLFASDCDFCAKTTLTVEKRVCIYYWKQYLEAVLIVCSCEFYCKVHNGLVSCATK